MVSQSGMAFILGERHPHFSFNIILNLKNLVAEYEEFEKMYKELAPYSQ